MHAKAAPTHKDPEAEAFYAESLRVLAGSGVPFLLAGTYAVSAYTGISRDTKDLDIFCKAGDCPRILAHFKALGYEVVVEDDRWIGKVRDGQRFFDVIFAPSNGTMPVGDTWFDHARPMDVLGTTVRLVAPTELIWSKCFVALRERYDGADVAHVMLRALLDRLANQRALPPADVKVCRGRMFSRSDYEIDIKQWRFEGETGPQGAARPWTPLGLPAEGRRAGRQTVDRGRAFHS